MNKLAYWCAIALLAAASASAEVPSLIAIRNVKVVSVSSPAMARATVVVRDGLIEDVGENVVIPAGAWVIEGAGLTVYPGLIDALSSAGITDLNALPPPPPAVRLPGAPAPPPPPQPPRAKGPEDRPATTSWLRAADLVKPTDPKVTALRSAGFTTAVSFPLRGIFAGQGAVVDLAGERGGDMVVATPAGQYITMQTAGFANFPGSLLGVIAYIRQVYLDAGHYQTVRAMYATNRRGMARPEYDRALDGVIESPRILLPARRKREMDRMIHFAHELGQKAVLYGMDEGYRATDLLKSSGIPVLVSLKWPEKPRDSDPDAYETLRTLEVRDLAPSTPAALANAGVPFAFYLDGLTNLRDIRRAMKRALDAGLSEDAAIRALTLGPAQIYGVDDRLGSIEKGKIANLVVTKDDVFGEKSEIRYIFVDGKKFEPAPQPETMTVEAPDENSHFPDVASNVVCHRRQRHCHQKRNDSHRHQGHNRTRINPHPRRQDC